MDPQIPFDATVVIPTVFRLSLLGDRSRLGWIAEARASVEADRR